MHDANAAADALDALEASRDDNDNDAHDDGGAGDGADDGTLACARASAAASAHEADDAAFVMAQRGLERDGGCASSSGVTVTRARRRDRSSSGSPIWVNRTNSETIWSPIPISLNVHIYEIPIQ